MPFNMAELFRSADGIADVMGVARDIPPELVNDDHSIIILRTQICELRKQPRHAQDAVHCEYAAKYLAKTIFRWRRNPDVMSAPPFLLSEISSCAYFTRLLLLPDNQDLVVMQVKRTLAAAPTIHYRDPEDFDRILHFLSTLLCVQGIGGISDADKNALVLVLRTWERKYPVGLKKNIATRCVVLLTGTPTLEFDRLMTMRGVALKGVEVCAGELCTRSAENGEPLLRCSRCKSAVYCRQEHQKAHWKKHKSLCFKVEY